MKGMAVNQVLWDTHIFRSLVCKTAQPDVIKAKILDFDSFNPVKRSLSAIVNCLKHKGKLYLMMELINVQISGRS
jgi:hypothetical protein